jgi:hypothetical protein
MKISFVAEAKLLKKLRSILLLAIHNPPIHPSIKSHRVGLGAKYLSHAEAARMAREETIEKKTMQRVMTSQNVTFYWDKWWSYCTFLELNRIQF